MIRPSSLSLFVSLVLGCLGSITASAQSGSWVLDGWPVEAEGYFAGRTEIVADGERLKITEWPGHAANDDEALVTYFLGKTVVKLFPWNGDRVGLVFEATNPLPKATMDAQGMPTLPTPYPSSVLGESDIPCGEGCVYHVRSVAFQPLETSMFAPGASLEDAFQPPSDVVLMSKQSFLERYRIEAPDWTRFDLGNSP